MPPADHTPQPSSPFATARIRHVALRVSDAEASKRWFAEKFDFHVFGEWTLREHRVYWLGFAGNDDFRIEIIGGNSPEPKPEFGKLDETFEYSGYHHLCIDVADIDVAVAELRRRGASIVCEPIDMAPLPRRIAFISDPWGNLVELAEVTA